MPAAAGSNIRAFVQWKNPSVYAGEEIECNITFRNVAAQPGSGREEQSEQSVLGNGAFKGRKTAKAPPALPTRKSSLATTKPPLSRAPSVTSGRALPTGKGHRPALSLNIVSVPSRAGLQSAPLQPVAPASAFKPAKSHGRSLSIMSLGSEAGSEAPGPASMAPMQRPARTHSRSASLQHLPKQLSQSSPSTLAQPRQPSPLYESAVPPVKPESSTQQPSSRPTRRKPGVQSAGNTPTLGSQPSSQRQTSTDSYTSNMNNFRFPAPQSPGPMSPTHTEPPKPVRNPSNMHSSKSRPLSPRPQDVWSSVPNSVNPISRVMSESSADYTPRSSSDFYSTSNRSDETLTSEQSSQQQQSGRMLPKPSHPRTASRSPQSAPARPETLMMAYAQTVGSFTLDGSLVNAAPFEEVKRKGVQGGGGVVGVERPKRSSGVFGAFSWSNIGESLGGLLGGDEMSSMAQMKASAGTKDIPLLSTPQSLLFVDLKLAPGESKSYSYRFSLPRGLPPSYKGRAIKISYHLAIGVQRPEGQAVRNVEIPFRVLGSYDARGEMLGHDLMTPYIMLQDAARTASIASGPPTSKLHPQFASVTESNKRKTPSQGLEDFLRYTERLVDARGESNGVLLSPTSPSSPSISRQQSLADQAPGNIKEVIDFAVLRSNLTNVLGKSAQAEAQSANRFNIARSGQPVAVLTMLRPAYRLGEAVIGTVDFTAPPTSASSPLPASTYSVLVELESTEQVDPSLSLRSSSSITRVTRKVFGSMRENALFARQLSFNLSIPSTATPTFETTGVSLTWQLKIEFTTQRQSQGLGIDKADGADAELLEELAHDERGTTYIAKELLLADTFEIAVPLKVYGAASTVAVGADDEAYVV